MKMIEFHSMNIFLHKRMKLNNKPLYVYIFMLYVFIFLKHIFAHKFVYWFERDDNSEIIFCSEVKQSNIMVEIFDESYSLAISYSFDAKPFNVTNHVFTYKNENSIRFEVLNSFFDADRLKNLCGRIECNFELEYILRISKDTSALSDKLNWSHFECLLVIFKYFKVVEDKSLSELLQGLFLKIRINQTFLDSIKTDVRIEGVFSKDIFVKSELSLKKIIISSFISTLMVKHVFYEGNLIILRNKKEFFDASLFNEHIPYKNLLINDFKVFCILENLFRNLEILNIFKVLLNQSNIKSLIFYDFLGPRTCNITFRFLTYLTDIFKSLIVFKPLGLSRIILFELNKFVNLNLEFITLKKLWVDRDTFVFLLKNQKIKGLILDNINFDVDIDTFREIIYFSETLEYVDIQNMEVYFYFSWWIELLRKSNIRKIILSFKSRFTTANFIYEWCKIEFFSKILHLEISFNYFEFCKEFCDSLWYFKYLQTLKLFDYESSKKIETYLLRAIKNMKELENISINNDFSSPDFFNFLFKKPEIKILHLNNSYFKKQTMNLETTNNYKSLKEIILKNINISENTLKEIFKLESLNKLSFEFCDFKSIKCTKDLDFMSKNILKLCLMGSAVKIFEDFDVFAYLEYLEKLQIFGRKIYLCNISNLCLLCNPRLKSLTYRSGVLHFNDLNRLKLLQVLEEFDICECELNECCFYQLSENCMFFDSLKYLNLGGVKIELHDFEYLSNFKNLIRIELSFSSVPLIQIKFIRVSPLNSHFFTKKTYDESNARNLLKKITEEAIVGMYEHLV